MVAAELADRDGINALSFTALAKALGVKPPSLYAHVSNFAELRQKIVVFGLNELEREIMRAGFGRSGTEALREVCAAYRAFALRRPGVYAATTLWPSPENAEVREATTRFNDLAMQIMEPLFHGLDRPERVHRLRIIRSALHGIASLEQAQAFWDPVDVDKTFEHMVDMLIDMTTKPKSDF